MATTVERKRREEMSLEERVQDIIDQLKDPNVIFGEPTFDPYLEAAGRNARAAADEAVRLGITDEFGNLLKHELPEDMREGADRDFGG